MVDTGVFPGKGIDIVVVELNVLGVEFVVVDAPRVVLVEGGGKGKVGGEVEDRSFEAFAAELLLLEGGSRGEGREGFLEVGGGKVWGIGEGCVELLEMGGGSGSFGAADPDVVGDAAEHAVPGKKLSEYSWQLIELPPIRPVTTYSHRHNFYSDSIYRFFNYMLRRELAYLSSRLNTVPNRYSK